MKTKSKINAYILRDSAAALLVPCVIVAADTDGGAATLTDAEDWADIEAT